MGDNRQISRDSRDPAVGFVWAPEIEGKVFFRLFPLKNAGGV
jgi:signal peptidase I